MIDKGLQSMQAFFKGEKYMLTVVEAPNVLEKIDRPTVFIAGSITGAEEWQKRLLQKISHLDMIVFNPRREKFPMDDPEAAEEQITWEFNYLKKASVISFWFAKNTISPITLFELGTWTKAGKPVVIGVDPEYPRRQDIEIQMKLLNSKNEIVYTIDDVAKGIEYWYNFFS